MKLSGKTRVIDMDKDWSNQTVKEWCDDHGFEECHTGGGCTALHKEVGDMDVYIATVGCAIPKTIHEKCAFSLVKDEWHELVAMETTLFSITII